MKITQENVGEKIKEILESPETSYWLKNAIVTGLSRDCIDACLDGIILGQILEAHADKLLGKRGAL